MRPRASGWEWAQAALLAINLIWTTLCLSGVLGETMAVTIALTGALLALHGLARAKETAAPALHPAGFWLLPFLGYALIHVRWLTPVPWLGWLDWLGWAQLVAIFWVVLNGVRSRGPRRMLFLTLAGLGVVAVLLACHQRFVNPTWLMLGRVQASAFTGQASGPFGIPNSLAAFLLLLLPASGLLAFRAGASAAQRVWWGWLTAVFVLGLVLSVSRGAWLGLGLALTGWALASRRLAWKKRLALAAGVLAALVLVTVAIGRMSQLGRERFARLLEDTGEVSRPLIWQGAWKLFREQPLLGSGAGSFNVLYERHRPAGFRDEPQWAHNDYLNTLSDYGAVGFALLFGALGVIAERAWRERAPTEPRRRDWLAALESSGAISVGLVAFALQLFVDFHFKIPALAMSFAVLLALALKPMAAAAAEDVATDGGLTRDVGKRRLGWLALTVLALTAVWPAANFYRAEGWRAAARQAIDDHLRKPRGDFGPLLARAQDDLLKAALAGRINANAWGDLAYAFELQAFLTPERRPEFMLRSEDAARRALMRSTAVAEFWIRLGVSLDTQRREAEAQGAFEAARRLAPRNYRTWYYYAYHLSLYPQRLSEAKEAIANCLALDPGNRQAESLREQLNGRP